MQNKVIGFTIQIKGEQSAVQNITDVRLAISETNKALKQTTDPTQYDQLNKQLIRLKGSLKQLTREQELAVQEFLATAEGVGAYKQLSAQLIIARQRYKDLAAAGKEYSEEAKKALEETQRLDAELKRIDANAGQFQRNVGNYPTSIKAVFESAIPGLNTLNEGMEEIGKVSSKTGRIIATSFLAFAVISEIIGPIRDLIGEVREVNEELTQTRRELTQLGVTSEKSLDRATISVQAFQKTFGTVNNELVTAANNFSRAFDIDVADGLDLIEHGFIRGANQSGEFLRILQEYGPQLRLIGLEADQAIDIITQQITDGIFTDKGIDAIKEAGISLRELTPATVTALEAIDISQEQIRTIIEEEGIGGAIRTVSRQLEGFADDSREVGMVLADVFRGAGEDAGIEYIRSLQNIGKEVDGLSDTTNVYAEQLAEQLEAEKELARVQNELSKQFQDTGNALSVTITRLKTFALDILLQVVKFFEEAPATFQGFKSAVGEITTEITNFFNRLAIDGAIAIKKLEKLNPFGRTNEEIEKDIQLLRKARGAFEDNGRSVGQAYREGLLEGLKDVEARREAAEVINQNSEVVRKTGNIISEEAKKAAEKLAKERAKLLEQEAQFAEDRLKLIAGLSRELVDAEIANIEDTRQREQEALKARFEARRQQLADQEIQLIRQIKEQDAELVKAFSEGAAEVAKFREESQQDLFILQSRINALEVEETERYRAERLEINKRYDEREAKQRLDAISTRLQEISDSYNLEILSLEEALARKQITEAEFEEQAFEKRKARLLKQRQELEDEIAKQRLNGTEGDEVDQLLARRQELNTELAKLEEDRTQKVIEESEKRIKANEEAFDEIADLSNEALDIAATFAEATRDRELAAFDERIEASQESIDEINRQLERATGAQRAELQQQLRQQEQILERETAAREEAEREFARKQRAISIIQALISGAQGIVKTGANLGYPAAIPFQIAQGIQTAAQIAFIRAQPLATGGVVQPVVLSDGRITAAQNIPALRNGDNVLATVRRGEVVLNKHQQRLLGGAATFRAIGVPGFASGGSVITGAPPSVTNTAVASSQDLMLAIQAVDSKTDAINNRVDRLQVYVVSEDVRDDLAEGDAIESEATFG